MKARHGADARAKAWAGARARGGAMARAMLCRLWQDSFLMFSDSRIGRIYRVAGSVEHRWNICRECYRLVGRSGLSKIDGVYVGSAPGLAWPGPFLGLAFGPGLGLGIGMGLALDLSLVQFSPIRSNLVQFTFVEFPFW